MSQFQVPVTRCWANSFVLRDSNERIQTKSVPQNEQGLEVLRVMLGRAVQDPNEDVQECTAELVCNLDEVGVSD
jgi:hypothetical protein